MVLVHIRGHAVVRRVSARPSPGADPGFWFGMGTGRETGDRETGGRKSPAGSRSRAPVWFCRRSPQEPEECYIVRLNECYILRLKITHCPQILLSALPTDQVFDQFAYKPTGSTTSALIAITHHISRLLESSSYVRCILIDYSKAFDTINHLTLFQKLRQLTIPPNVLLWIINFLSGRTQAVSSFGQISSWLPVSRSIIQGSGIGPYLYLVYASDLRTLSPHNVIIKYADDTTLLVGQHSSVDIIQEYDNICAWSARNKLTINSDKTKEIIFHRPA